jgi:cation:H+ antiporter
MPLFLHIMLFLAGVIVLGVGAQFFVKSSCQIGEHFRIPPLVAGIILVGFGGSFPEITVSLIAAMHGEASMSVGNAIGSNIVNLGMVLSISALVMPIVVSPVTLKRDVPLLGIVMAIVYGLLLWTHHLTPLIGCILIGLLVIYLGLMIWSIRKNQHDLSQQVDASASQQKVLWKVFLAWTIGLVLLFISSEMLVSSASAIAAHFGMSPLLIGLTIVAIGTSLPEFATTVISAYKGHHDIALGNVLGSNIFNLLAVLAMPALFSPTPVSHQLLTRDYPVMIVMTIIALVGALLPRKTRVIGRVTAFALLFVWFFYYSLLF